MKERELHPSMTRLYEAAKKLRGLTKPAEIGRVIGASPQTMTNWESRGISQKGAVEIQRALGCNSVWLLDGTGQMVTLFNPSLEELVNRREPQKARAENFAKGEVEIRQFDAGGGMGSGRLLLDDQPGVIKSWHVDEEWLRLNVRGYTSVQNLCIVTGFGPSMRPMFNPGDPLLVDLGVKSVDSDAVYFFRVDGHGYIKALQRIPTANGTMLRAKSKNPDYDPFEIDVKTMDFEVLGKVLTVWRSEQF